jgi:hypothetical protein
MILPIELLEHTTHLAAAGEESPAGFQPPRFLPVLRLKPRHRLERIQHGLVMIG